ncbi:transmembrane, partial [Cystoisospora suis]
WHRSDSGFHDPLFEYAIGGAGLAGVVAVDSGLIVEAGDSGSFDGRQQGVQSGVSVLPPLQVTLSQTGKYPVWSPDDLSFSPAHTVPLAFVPSTQTHMEQPQVLPDTVVFHSTSMRSPEATSSSASAATPARRASLETKESGELSPDFQSENGDGDGCKSAEDLEIIEGSLLFSPGNRDRFLGSARPSTRFYEILFSCGRRSFGNEEKTTRCVQDHLWVEAHRRLSDSCMRCFSRSVGCGASNCKGPCFFSSCAASCLECSEESCSADLLRCSGLSKLPEPCVPDITAGVLATTR